MMQPTNSVQARVMRTSRTSSCKMPEQEETHQPRSGQPRNTPPQLQVHREVCRSKLSSSRPMAQEQCTSNQQRHNTNTRGSAGQDDCQDDCLAGMSESLLQRQPIFSVDISIYRRKSEPLWSMPTHPRRAISFRASIAAIRGSLFRLRCWPPRFDSDDGE